MRPTLPTIALLVTVAGCVGLRVGPPANPCHEVYGACVLYAVDAPPQVRQRIGPAFKASATHWNTAPTAIAGWTVVVHGYGPQLWFGGVLWGLTNPGTKRVDIWVQYPTCPEVVTMHEWGHAASLAAGGDGLPHHVDSALDDPRFDEAAILATLRGTEGCP
jgi:hypothetical protein